MHFGNFSRARVKQIAGYFFKIRSSIRWESYLPRGSST